MPTNALPPVSGSTYAPGLAFTNLAEGGTAFISEVTQFPWLGADYGAGAAFNYISAAWRMEVRTERPAYRQQLDDRDYPAAARTPPSPIPPGWTSARA
jgi:hypothetical protein